MPRVISGRVQPKRTAAILPFTSCRNGPSEISALSVAPTLLKLLNPSSAAGKHAAGNRVHSLISKVFSFAIDADLLEANPAARLRKRGVEKVGRRVLTDDEIRKFWRGIVLPPVSRQVGLALRLALLTAARASEVAGARKSDFDHIDAPARAAWPIPGERTKNKRDHLIPLPRLAVETVKTAVELSGDSEFVFPTRLGRGGPIDRHTLTVAMVRFAKRSKGHGCEKRQLRTI